MSATGPPHATFHRGPEIPISNHEAEGPSAVHCPRTLSYTEGEERRRKGNLTYWNLEESRYALLGGRGTGNLANLITVGGRLPRCCFHRDR